jgi:CRISPR-associated protein Cst1
MITIRLNNFLFNAGVVGFWYLLENNKDKIPSSLYRINGSELLIDPKIFTNEQIDLSAVYFNSLQTRFKADTSWSRLMDLEGEIARLDLTSDEGQRKFDLIINDGLLGKYKKLESSSYKSGYEIVKQQFGEMYDVLTEWKALKKDKDQELQRDKLLRILQYIKQYPEVFCYKDIAYNKIQYIWNGVAFLYAQNSKKDMLQCYRDTFVIPLRNYLNNPKQGKEQCIECGEMIKKDDAMGLSWLQMGVDHKRKKSYFWNFIPDSFLCPVCSFIYSCAPLGFTFAAGRSDAVFINNNISITDLIQDNKTADLKLEKRKNAGEICYYLTSELIQKAIRLKEHEIDNIQVVIRYGSMYDIGIISKDKLEILKIKQCRSSFETLIPIYIKIGKNDYLSVYREVLHNFLANINQYPLIDRILRTEERPRYAWHVLRIQIHAKGGANMTIKYFDAKKSRDCGLALRKVMAGKNDEQTDNKVRGLAYQLLNALQVRDINRFMEIICRVYTGLSKEIPAIFLQMFSGKDEDTFRNLGYAFILGLKGENDRNEDKKDAKSTDMESNDDESLLESKEEVSNE